MSESNRVIIFDLDGTLVDSLPDIVAAINEVMASRELKLLTRQEAACFMGDGLSQFAQRAFASRGLQASDEDVTTFIHCYARQPAARSQLYDGVPETLRTLVREGWRMVVCTNKAEHLARQILTTLGIVHHFNAICGGDTVPRRKPDPMHLQASIARAGIGEHGTVIMVGDYAADIAAATALGIPSIFAAWGYGEASMGKQASRIATHFSDLPGLVGAWSTGTRGSIDDLERR